MQFIPSLSNKINVLMSRAPMFINIEPIIPLQDEFSLTREVQNREYRFAYTLLALKLPFASATSNLLPSLTTLFELEIKGQRRDTFMGSTTPPWSKLWRTLWG